MYVCPLKYRQTDGYTGWMNIYTRANGGGKKDKIHSIQHYMCVSAVDYDDDDDDDGACIASYNVTTAHTASI